MTFLNRKTLQHEDEYIRNSNSIELKHKIKKPQTTHLRRRKQNSLTSASQDAKIKLGSLTV